MNNIFSSLKSLLSLEKKNDTSRNEGDDYAIAKSKRFDLVIKIISVVGAVIIWLLAVTSDAAVYTRDFNSLRISTPGYSEFLDLAEEKGYEVTDNASSMFVNISIKGRNNMINTLKENEIGVTADFREHMDFLENLDPAVTTVFKIPIVIDVPKYFSVASVSPEYIEVILVPSADLDLHNSRNTKNK